MKKLVSLAAAAAAMSFVPTAVSAQQVGDWVLSQWRDSTQYFPGVIIARSGPSLTIRFDDGATETRLINTVRPYNWRVGSRITCRWTDGNWYDATIEAMGSDGMTLGIRYDADGVRQRTNTGRCRTRG